MEAELSKKINEIKEQNKGTIGVLLVDNLGLPIESTGQFDKVQSGLVSSIMKNAAKLQALLSTSQVQAPEADGEQQQQVSHASVASGQTVSDSMAKIYFKKENLVLRSKNNMTIALRQEVSE